MFGSMVVCFAEGDSSGNCWCCCCNVFSESVEVAGPLPVVALVSKGRCPAGLQFGRGAIAKAGDLGERAYPDAPLLLRLWSEPAGVHCASPLNDSCRCVQESVGQSAGLCKGEKNLLARWSFTLRVPLSSTPTLIVVMRAARGRGRERVGERERAPAMQSRAE